MPWSKPGWISRGHTVCSTLLFVFCVLFIVDSTFSTRMMRSGVQAYESGVPMTLVPAILARAPEYLVLGLRVESRDFPTEELTKTEAWSELQGTLSEYARGLEYVKAQNRLWERRDMKRGQWLFWLYFASGVGFIVFERLDRRSRKMDSKKPNQVHG